MGESNPIPIGNRIQSPNKLFFSLGATLEATIEIVKNKSF